MKSFIKSYSYLLFFALLAAPLAHAKPVQQAFDSSIVVMAPASMSNALHEIMRNFSREENISMSGTFESSGEISKMILDGEAANIYITDDATQMRDLQRLGVLNVFSMANIISDKIVIAVPQNHYLIKKMETLKSTDEKLQFIAKNFSLVIPDPEIDPAGRAAQQALTKLKLWDMVSKKMLKASNTRNSLYLVSNGNNPGIVYNSDANTDSNVHILLEVPAKYYESITYQASIIAEVNADANTKISERFLDYIKSPEAADIFLRYGFTPFTGSGKTGQIL